MKAPTVFPGDASIRHFVGREHGVVHRSEFDPGSVFAAMEAPDVLVGDVRKYFRRFR
jgi:hypothetical protein